MYPRCWPETSTGPSSLKYHFFRSHIGKDKGIIAKCVHTSEQKADIFTKGLN